MRPIAAECDSLPRSSGEKLIVTAGGLDTHVHFICPQLVPEALASGVTTLYGGGTGPNHGTLATTITPAPSQVQRAAPPQCLMPHATAPQRISPCPSPSTPPHPPPSPSPPRPPHLLPPPHPLPPIPSPHPLPPVPPIPSTLPSPTPFPLHPSNLSPPPSPLTTMARSSPPRPLANLALADPNDAAGN